MVKKLKKICLIVSFALTICFMTVSTLGKKSIVVPPALEEKMKADDTIDKVNEDTKKLNENAENIDKE